MISRVILTIFQWVTCAVGKCAYRLRVRTVREKFRQLICLVIVMFSGTCNKKNCAFSQNPSATNNSMPSYPRHVYHRVLYRIDNLYCIAFMHSETGLGGNSYV